eukprot:7132725-Prymnesium_polylepis.1
MADAHYAIIVDGEGRVTERSLADHAPGAALPPSVTVVSSSVAGDRRTVVLTRAAQGKPYSLPAAAGPLRLIAAVGSGAALAYHRARTGGALVLVAADVASCVCEPAVEKSLVYMDKTEELFAGCARKRERETGSGRRAKGGWVRGMG